MSKENKNIKMLQNTLYVLKFCFKYCPFYTIMSLINKAKANFVVFLEFTLMLSFLINTIQYKQSAKNAFIFVLGVLIFKIINTWINNILSAKVNQIAEAKLSTIIRRELFKKSAEIDLECYDNPEYYTDFVWAMSEAFDRMKKVITTLDGIIGSIALFLMTGIFMLKFDIIGIVFVATSFIFTFLVNITINKRLYEMDIKTKPLIRKRDYVSRVFYLNDFSKELRLYNIKNKLFKDFDKVNEEIADITRHQTKSIVVLTFLRDILFGDIIMEGFYIIYLLFRAIVQQNIGYGTIVALFSVTRRLQSSLSSFAQLVPQMYQNSLYIDRLIAFLAYQVKIVNKPQALEVPETTKVLELKDVCFCYQPGQAYVVDNVSMEINSGEKIAIVGYNGAGKTTLIKLLMRLYDATEGQILYNNVPIQDYDVKAYHNLFGTVFQDYQLFAASLAQNVTMQQGEVDKEKIKQSLASAGFSKRLSTLSKGLDTQVTKEFDNNGINFSMGEAQKIAISRTLYKNCGIIILDEPSSALDPIAEYNLNNTILNNCPGATVIFISHRLSTTKHADRIYMFEHGRIIEQGSHDELMALKGKYAEMFLLQSEKYQLFGEYDNIV